MSAGLGECDTLPLDKRSRRSCRSPPGFEVVKSLPLTGFGHVDFFVSPEGESEKV